MGRRASRRAEGRRNNGRFFESCPGSLSVTVTMVQHVTLHAPPAGTASPSPWPLPPTVSSNHIFISCFRAFAGWEVWSGHLPPRGHSILEPYVLSQPAHPAITLSAAGPLPATHVIQRSPVVFAPCAVSEEDILSVIKAWRATAEGHGVDADEVGHMVECLAPRFKDAAGGVRPAASALHDLFDTEKVRRGSMYLSVAQEVGQGVGVARGPACVHRQRLTVTLVARCLVWSLWLGRLGPTVTSPPPPPPSLLETRSAWLMQRK
jgi:hypothetical protein